uniref:Membrane magnesium transporter n=1 Tax=Piliocolobus tephrosceles TaxID=591936 RepID=A0A8C9LL84_9PRIM
ATGPAPLSLPALICRRPSSSLPHCSGFCLFVYDSVELRPSQRGLHSADRSYMRLTEKEDESLPIDIVLQTLLAFAVTCYGIVHIAGEFKDMDATSELKNK